jgi:hypothetical protein
MTSRRKHQIAIHTRHVASHPEFQIDMMRPCGRPSDRDINVGIFKQDYSAASGVFTWRIELMG